MNGRYFFLVKWWKRFTYIASGIHFTFQKRSENTWHIHNQSNESADLTKDRLGRLVVDRDANNIEERLNFVKPFRTINRESGVDNEY